MEMVGILLDNQLGRLCLTRADVDVELVALSVDSVAAEETNACLFSILVKVVGYEVTKEAEATVVVETGLNTLTIKPQDKRRVAWYSGDTPPYATSWDFTMPVVGTGKIGIKISGTVTKCTVRAELLIVTKREEKPC
jgi:hypothetical protein